MKALAYLALVGGGVWWMEKRRKERLYQQQQVAVPPSGIGVLPQLVDCSPMSLGTVGVPPLAVELGETVNLCGATAMDAVVLKVTGFDSLPELANPAGFERDGDYFRFKETGAFLIGSEAGDGWVVISGDLIPCIQGGTTSMPVQVTAAVGFPIKLCDLVEGEFTVLMNNQQNEEAWSVMGEVFIGLEAGRYIVTRTAGGGPVWDIIVEPPDLNPEGNA